MDNIEAQRRAEYLLKIKEVEQTTRDMEEESGASYEVMLLPSTDYSTPIGNKGDGWKPETQTSSLSSARSGSNANNINRKKDISYLPNPSYSEYAKYIPPTSLFQSTGKIHLPKSRESDGLIITGYAQRNIMDNRIYQVPDLGKYDIHKWESTFPRFTGEGRLRYDFVYYLSILADKVLPKLNKKKLSLNSTFRTMDKQSTIAGWGAAPYGPHMGGTAVDIAAYGGDRYLIADAAYYMNFGGIAIGKTFVHVDIGAYKRWVYDGTPTYYSPERRKG